MSQCIVRPAGPLHGTVRASGSKNAALPILAATILTDTVCTIREVPPLTDIQNMCALLQKLGSRISVLHTDALQIENSAVRPLCAAYADTCRLRASFLIAGPLLARYGQFTVSLPGGCKIGTRPIDLHLKGFQALGAFVSVSHGIVSAKADRLIGNTIYLDFPSVGATENIMMAATLADGETVIENAAAEPEIINLADFLSAMGATISGAGTDTVRISGVSALHGSAHTVIPDRIEAGTLMTAAAITGGSVCVQNVIPDHIKPLTAKMREMGVRIKELPTSVMVEAGEELVPTDIKTLPYPGFPTDMQSQFCALMSVAKGTGIVTETIFENRFMHINELRRMGADITLEGRAAIIKGAHLTGASVSASDLRAGAALLLAGLCADGETQVCDSQHIIRGYADLPGKLRSLGADVTWLPDKA